ncbi:hypothetical protein GCM10009850_095910 [Nonomuraea monospora]|uniref:non-specific serine/threonine protein kinase n=1 Tax=Nonomuraea monospora TaxID=568818 RepID=A0ABN3CX87_9ACTN
MSHSRGEGWLLAGRYRLLAELGQGGMGKVWRGHDELLDRPVAVKEVALDQRPQSERETLLSRTMTEARLAGRLSHPNITTVYDVVEADGRPWIVLQLISAPTLADVLDREGPLPPVTVARIGLQILDALKTAHAAGVVHRDVKPANILLDDGRRHAVLTDFGLATSLERPSDVTDAGIVVGTPAYIAPERARGGPPSPQTDLWSLGVTLYTAVEGRPPFEEGSVLATISAVLTTDPAPSKRAGALAPLIAGLLSKDPADRPGVDEARRRLRRVVDAVPDAVPQTGTFAPPPGVMPACAPGAARSVATRWFRRERVRHVTLVGVLVAGAVVAWAWPHDVPDRVAEAPATGAPAPPPDEERTRPAGVLEARPVVVRRRGGEAAPRVAGTSAVSLPPGQAKKTGHAPPGLTVSHPGKGKGRK